MHHGAMQVWALAAVLAAGSAEARFGKASSTPDSSTHSASSAKDGDGSSGEHSASSVGSAVSSAARSWSFSLLNPREAGYWSAAFVPWFGYGFRHHADESIVVGPEPGVVEEEESTRLVVGAEGMYFGNGFTIGANASFEIGQFGIAVTGANIAVKADDGSNGWDNLQQVTGHLTWAFLMGRHGRWRAELGADMVFAPNLIVVGPTVGTSGTVWLVGPLAAEGAINWTFYPYDQVDLKMGLALGAGPVGFRAGYRWQLLSDRGLVDGVVNTDIFSGPYLGIGVAM